MTDDPRWLADPEYLRVLRSAYNILDIIEFKSFDLDWSWFDRWAHQHNKVAYGTKDRFLVVHFDTDFYWHHHGININNLINRWRDLGMPLHTMLLYTNHLGIGQEIDRICAAQDPKDRPTVIETFINPGNYLDHYPDVDLDTDAITHHALCLMAGSPRSHRYGVYNHLGDLAPHKIALTLKGTGCI